MTMKMKGTQGGAGKVRITKHINGKREWAVKIEEITKDVNGMQGGVWKSKRNY